MNGEQSEELTREERAALRDLGSDGAPAELEERVVSALRAKGLVRRFWRVPLVPRLAMATAMLLGAFWLGVRHGRGEEGSEPAEARIGPPAGEPVAPPAGQLMARAPEVPAGTSWAAVSAKLAGTPDANGGAFPPAPLDGRPRDYSPKYR